MVSGLPAEVTTIPLLRARDFNTRLKPKMSRMTKLTERQIKARMSKTTGWRVNVEGEIEKTFVLPGFPQSLMFVTAVGLLAEAAQHHPDITIKWNKVTLALTTHDVGGLSEKDFDLAKQVDALPVFRD